MEAAVYESMPLHQLFSIASASAQHGDAGKCWPRLRVIASSDRCPLDRYPFVRCLFDPSGSRSSESHWPTTATREGFSVHANGCHGRMCTDGMHTDQATRKRRSKEELTITDSELRAMAAPAIIGLSQPKAAIGMPIPL